MAGCGFDLETVLLLEQCWEEPENAHMQEGQCGERKENVSIWVMLKASEHPWVPQITSKIWLKIILHCTCPNSSHARYLCRAERPPDLKIWNWVPFVDLQLWLAVSHSSWFNLPICFLTQEAGRICLRWPILKSCYLLPWEYACENISYKFLQIIYRDRLFMENHKLILHIPIFCNYLVRNYWFTRNCKNNGQVPCTH